MLVCYCAGFSSAVCELKLGPLLLNKQVAAVGAQEASVDKTNKWI